MGVPPKMLDLIRSLHHGMQAPVRISGAVTEEISVLNSLHQGFPLAPTL